MINNDVQIITDPHAQIAELIEAINEQKQVVEYETSVLKARQEMLLTLMDHNGFDKIKTDKGSVTVCKGKRTVSVTDPALKAEIKLLQERGVRTGRCEERIGQRYCLIRR
jgi:penicillin V acylase-like amidase (Ntn superfamily)